jgi:hypothetical protein
VLPEHSPKNAAGEAALYLAGGELFFQAINDTLPRRALRSNSAAAHLTPGEAEALIEAAKANGDGLRDVTMILLLSGTGSCTGTSGRSGSGAMANPT